jgi:hypothetical protein
MSMIKVNIMPVQCVSREVIQIVECEQTLPDEIRSGNGNRRKLFMEFNVLQCVSCETHNVLYNLNAVPCVQVQFQHCC